MDKKSKLIKRIGKFLKLKGINRSQFAKMWGYDRSMITLIMDGDRFPGRRKISELIKISDGYFRADDFF